MRLVSRTLTEAVKARARELGFDRVAVGPADVEHGAALERWLDAGYAAGMSYMERTRAERLDPGRLLPDVRSSVAVALLYDHRQLPADPGLQAVARYARGRDYHDVMRPRLADLARFIDEAAGAHSRAAVDTSAVLERDLAARAGLGWVGKNTNLLATEIGSYFFIGIVLTTADLETDDPQPDRCGTCTACLDACPTGAFPAPYVLDASRCISYLTIEHRGSIAEALRPALRDWIFGCDVCQEVCPWNRKAAPATEPAFAPALEVGDPQALLGLDHDEFRTRFRGTALWRGRRAGLLRNAAIVLGSRGGGPGAITALRHATGDDDPVVAEAATWALERLEGGPERGSLVQGLLTPDPRAAGPAAPERERPMADTTRGRKDAGPLEHDDRKDADSGRPVQLPDDRKDADSGRPVQLPDDRKDAESGRPVQLPGEDDAEGGEPVQLDRSDAVSGEPVRLPQGGGPEPPRAT